jgi:hypothetical protein
MVDEAPESNALHGRYQMEQINYKLLYSTDTGIYTYHAEDYFSGMRRGEIGNHHHVAGPYLVWYAEKSAWREDYRRVDNGSQVKLVIGLAMAAAPSVDWCGYWQRSRKYVMNDQMRRWMVIMETAARLSEARE